MKIAILIYDVLKITLWIGVAIICLGAVFLVVMPSAYADVGFTSEQAVVDAHRIMLVGNSMALISLVGRVVIPRWMKRTKWGGM